MRPVSPELRSVHAMRPSYPSKVSHFLLNEWDIQAHRGFSDKWAATARKVPGRQVVILLTVAAACAAPPPRTLQLIQIGITRGVGSCWASAVRRLPALLRHDCVQGEKFCSGVGAWRRFMVYAFYEPFSQTYTFCVYAAQQVLSENSDFYTCFLLQDTSKREMR